MEGENVVIDEETYQQIKKEMCKTDDYFSVEEWENLVEKISVILA